MAHKHEKTLTYIDPALSNAVKAASAMRGKTKTKLLEDIVTEWLIKEEPEVWKITKEKVQKQK